MQKTSLKERLWACLAHVPIITIIWTIYLIFHHSTFGLSNLRSALINPSSAPITPIALTLLSVPIAMGIMRLQRKSFLAHQNAQEVLTFNIWLLKGYAAALVFACIGIFFNSTFVGYAAAGIALFLAMLSLGQAFIGVITALRGGIYCYWYPGKNSRFIQR